MKIDDPVSLDERLYLESHCHGGWQIVSESSQSCISCDRLERMRVPGGWIYRNTCDLDILGIGKGIVITNTFVPDSAQLDAPNIEELRLACYGERGQDDDETST